MDYEKPFQNRFIIASNRLPFVLTRDEKGEWQINPGSGGLVTALAPVLKNRGGVWIGWPGTSAEESKDVDIKQLLASQTRSAGYTLEAVNLSAGEVENYYKGFANEIIWPLFHDFPAYCNFDPGYWQMYQHVNRKFAEAIAQNIRDSDFIWVHDYHLMGVAKELREMNIKTRIGFFLHIPFPPLDIFVRLPWRFQILRALLEYDLVGFQTLRDSRNFLLCVQTLIKYSKGFGKAQVSTLYFEGREIRVAAFPISIDYREFANTTKREDVAKEAWYIHEELPNRKIILGIDRLDYSKGIPERLKAFKNALIRFPELRENISFVQVVVPSRREIPKYDELKREIERLVGEINGQFTCSGWVPIHYFFRSLDRRELLAYYRTSEIALITPLKDGMNLIAKEYCASNLEGNGVLVLSEFAGAAAQLQKGALLVNPHDIEGVAEAIHQAFHMSKDERQLRMRKLRQSIRKYDIFWWVDRFLEAAFSKGLDNFPILEDYVPKENGE